MFDSSYTNSYPNPSKHSIKKAEEAEGMGRRLTALCTSLKMILTFCNLLFLKMRKIAEKSPKLHSPWPKYIGTVVRSLVGEFSYWISLGRNQLQLYARKHA